MEKLHIWEVLPNAPSELYVRFTDDFIQELSNKLPGKKGKIMNRIGFSRSLWSHWKNMERSIPLSGAMELTKMTEPSLEKMENNIRLYKQKYTPLRCSVKCPKLPLEITPEFVSFAAHFCFDGSLPANGHILRKMKNRSESLLEKLKIVLGCIY